MLSLFSYEIPPSGLIPADLFLLQKRDVADRLWLTVPAAAFNILSLKLRKYLRRRYFLHNKTAQRSIKLLHSNVFYVQGHSRLTAERHRSAMLLSRSDSLRLETRPGLRSKSRKVPCKSHRTSVRCGLPPLLSHFPNQLKLGKNAFLPEEP